MMVYGLAAHKALASGKVALWLMRLLQFPKTSLMAISCMEQHKTKKASHSREELLPRMDALVLTIQALLHSPDLIHCDSPPLDHCFAVYKSNTRASRITHNKSAA
jgi:hypothetical protein